jgi:hypothetical protein
MHQPDANLNLISPVTVEYPMQSSYGQIGQALARLHLNLPNSGFHLLAGVF